MSFTFALPDEAEAGSAEEQPARNNLVGYASDTLSYWFYISLNSLLLKMLLKQNGREKIIHLQI